MSKERTSDLSETLYFLCTIFSALTWTSNALYIPVATPSWSSKLDKSHLFSSHTDPHRWLPMEQHKKKKLKLYYHLHLFTNQIAKPSFDKWILRWPTRTFFLKRHTSNFYHSMYLEFTEKATGQTRFMVFIWFLPWKIPNMTFIPQNDLKNLNTLGAVQNYLHFQLWDNVS